MRRCAIGRGGAEERDSLAGDGLGGHRPQRRADHGHARLRHLAQRRGELGMACLLLGHRDDDEVGDQRAVGVEVAGGDAHVLMRADDEHTAAGGDGWQRGAAAVEEHQVRLERGRQARSLEHVRDGHGACQPAAAATAADRVHTCQRGRLQMVGGRVAAGIRECEERLHGRRHPDHLGLRRSAPPHGHHDDAARAGRETRQVPRDRRLPDSLAGADDREGRRLDRREDGRLEAEVRAFVRDAEREHAAGEPQALDRAEHGLVRQVDDGVRAELLEGALHALAQRHAVALAAAQLLGAAHQHRGDDEVGQRLEGVADDRRVVLAVDEDENASHGRDDTSRSMRPVYFSYSYVSTENWMMRSCP